MNAVGDKLLTAEEFFELPIEYAELARGKVAPLSFFDFWTGCIAVRLSTYLHTFIEKGQPGRAAIGYGIITRRAPDSFRRADLCYYSFERVPADVNPDTDRELTPDFVFLFDSPCVERDVIESAREFLAAGTLAVCVVDSSRELLVTYRLDRPQEVFPSPCVWSVADILPGLEIPLSSVFGSEK